MERSRTQEVLGSRAEYTPGLRRCLDIIQGREMRQETMGAGLKSPHLFVLKENRVMVKTHKQKNSLVI